MYVPKYLDTFPPYRNRTNINVLTAALYLGVNIKMNLH